MKIQLLTAAVVIALTSSTAFASKSHGHHKGGGTDLTNNSKNALAIGDASGVAGALGGFGIVNSGGRAVAGSIYLEGAACACDFDNVKNKSRNAIAVGNATAGSIHVNTMGRP